MEGGGWWGATNWQVTAELCIFQGEMAQIALKVSQNIAKSMVYIINQSYGDFQQGDCLYKPTSGIQWTSEHSWTSDKPQKHKPQQKQTCQHLAVVYWQLVSLLMELSIDMVCVSGGFWQSRSHNIAVCSMKVLFICCGYLLWLALEWY